MTMREIAQKLLDAWFRAEMLALSEHSSDVSQDVVSLSDDFNDWEYEIRKAAQEEGMKNARAA